jgi:hypothetical protein
VAGEGGGQAVQCGLALCCGGGGRAADDAGVGVAAHAGQEQVGALVGGVVSASVAVADEVGVGVQQD